MATTAFPGHPSPLRLLPAAPGRQRATPIRGLPTCPAPKSFASWLSSQSRRRASGLTAPARRRQASGRQRRPRRLRDIAQSSHDLTREQPDRSPLTAMSRRSRTQSRSKAAWRQGGCDSTKPRWPPPLLKNQHDPVHTHQIANLSTYLPRRYPIGGARGAMECAMGDHDAPLGLDSKESNVGWKGLR
jgi:hypothetical protein